MKDKHSPIRQGFDDAVVSFLPMSVFLIFMKVIYWEIYTHDPHDQYDSRIGMIFPVILPLFFLGVVFGIRACRTVVRLYQQDPSLLTLPSMLGITGLLVPFFLGLLLAARFLIRLNLLFYFYLFKFFFTKASL